MNCHSPESTDLRPTLASTGSAAESSKARTLKLLKESQRAGGSRPETGNPLGAVAPQIGRRYELDLSTHEDWTCATFLLHLSREEKGKKVIRDCHWSEQDGGLPEDGHDFTIPKKWFTKAVPKEGELQLSYAIESPEVIDNEARRTLAENLFGWQKA